MTTPTEYRLFERIATETGETDREIGAYAGRGCAAAARAAFRRAVPTVGVTCLGVVLYRGRVQPGSWAWVQEAAVAESHVEPHLDTV